MFTVLPYSTHHIFWSGVSSSQDGLKGIGQKHPKALGCKSKRQVPIGSQMLRQVKEANQKKTAWQPPRNMTAGFAGMSGTWI